MNQPPLLQWLFRQLTEQLKHRHLTGPAILFTWIELNYVSLLKTDSFVRGDFLNGLIRYHRLLLDALDYRKETLQIAIDRDLNLNSFRIETIPTKKKESLDHQISIEPRDAIFDTPASDADGLNLIKERDNRYLILEPKNNEEFDPEGIIESLALAVEGILSSNRKAVSILIDSPPEMVINYIFTARLVKYRFPELISLSVYFVDSAKVKDKIKGLPDLKDFSRRYGIAEYCDGSFLLSKWMNSALTMKDIYDKRKDETIQTLKIRAKRHFPSVPPYRELTQDEKRFINNCKISDPRHQHTLRKLLEVVGLPHQTILLLGETGVGKSFIAKKLHEHSTRKNKPFVHINCAAISPNLLEAELFGAAPGSFTGISPKGIKGKIEMAEGGTLFLDEITEATPEFQSKLLTFLDTWNYYKVGDVETETSNVSLICAFNRDPEIAMSDGKLREDLYFRINTYSFTIPPLRERKDELEEIITGVFDKKKNELGLPDISLPDESLNYLKSLPWKGNFRQLENYMNNFLIDCKFLPSAYLTLAIIKNSSVFTKNAGRLSRFEEGLDELFQTWNEIKPKLLMDKKFSEHFINPERDANYIDGFLKPILAEMFITKYGEKYNQKDAYKLIGMSWEKTAAPIVIKKDVYPIIKRYFSQSD